MNTNDNQTRKLALENVINDKCLTVGQNFTLSTGKKVNWYFDCKMATLNGRYIIDIADLFIELINEFEVQPTAISGLTMGADPIITAVTIRSFQQGGNITDGSIVRKEPKKHGSGNHIENDLGKGTKIVVVDDVITTGKSTAIACDYLIEAGYLIVGIIALIDRESGGIESLKKKYNCNVQALFKKNNFAKMKKLNNETYENSETSERIVASA